MLCKLFSAVSVSLILNTSLTLATGWSQDQAAAKPNSPRIQIAILLDTSGSMEGLINQARAQLWRMVNEFGKAKCGTEQPRLEVALFEYGNDGLPAAEGYTRLIVPFTDDLDKVSQELFALKTNGGSEFCGWVIDQAARTLDWSNGHDDLRCIFIAGNEPFSQGPKPYQDACRSAIQRGVTVSTIHCGDYATGVSTGWEEGARMADGSFLNIDQNQAVVDVATPHDVELVTLSSQLNLTYLAYGSSEKRAEFLANQTAQDSNAAQLGAGVAAVRGATKASPHYRNDARDLVDALREGSVSWAQLKDEELPEELKNLPSDQRQAYVDKKTQERIDLQSKIKELTAQREQFLAEARANQAATPESESLGDALIMAARAQAERQNYQFSK